jgi:signal transduction histidine kinase
MGAAAPASARMRPPKTSRTLSILAVFNIAAAVFLVVSATMYWTSARRVSEAHETRYASYLLADELRQSSDDLTRLVRSYVITGDPRYERWYWDVLSIRNGKTPRPADYNRIYWDFVTAGEPTPSSDGEAVPLATLLERAGLTEDERSLLARAQANSDRLVQLERRAMNAVRGRFADSRGNFTVQAAPDPSLARALVFGTQYQAAKAGIMRPLDAFLEHLDERTLSRVAAAEATLETWRALSIVATLLLASMALLTLWYYRSRVVRVLLETNVELRASHAAQLADEENLRELNVHLEERVDERTSQLEATNQELEAFAHSVSHDLRAPLRAIDGFSQILIEDHGDSLEEDGRESLERVRAAAQRMGHLIDALLALSRVNRHEMQIDDVDLRGMAADIVSRFREEEPQRHVEVTLAPGLTARGDPGLLEVLLGNLLGNAWKFTGNSEDAHIEFAEARRDGHRVFFVRDDGAGFDMAFADKLFIPFQRLQGPQEFPGTGIGLATVQRIVSRHGGRIWAEGVVGQGATFFFTLGTPVV